MIIHDAWFGLPARKISRGHDAVGGEPGQANDRNAACARALQFTSQLCRQTMFSRYPSLSGTRARNQRGTTRAIDPADTLCAWSLVALAA
jgi:hypothetical protein